MTHDDSYVLGAIEAYGQVADLCEHAMRENPAAPVNPTIKIVSDFCRDREREHWLRLQTARMTHDHPARRI